MTTERDSLLELVDQADHAIHFARGIAGAVEGDADRGALAELVAELVERLEDLREKIEALRGEPPVT